MIRTVLLISTAVALLGVGACVGKGKAPPPAPAVAPVVTKG